MSTAITSAPSRAPSLTPRNATDNLNPETCVSLASILRCYYSDLGPSTKLLHTLLIIPVALELIFSTSLIFTNWRSGRRHLLLVAEGLVIFLLSLAEVLSFEISAVRTQVLAFKTTDQAIGALSFIQLLFYMSFLYSWVRSECLPIIPSRFRRIARPLLLLFIPAVIALNAVASFVGVSYYGPVPGRNHIEVAFRDDRARFVWPFFSSATLALFTLFQASCFCFAFYRLMRALWIQGKLETDAEDAAVLFRGIGWINAGIKLGAIETVIGFVFFGGIPIAYVRRILRLFSRAFLSIGVAKGIDGTEDFKAIQDELESSSSEKSFRRSKLRRLISKSRFSTFSPTATAFHSASRAPALDGDLTRPLDGEKPHPYSADALIRAEGNSQSRRNSLYGQSPLYGTNVIASDTISGGSLISPKPTTNAGLPGISQIAENKAKRMSQHTQERVTVHYNQGTPTLHLRLSILDLPNPVITAENVEGNEFEEYRNSLMTQRSPLKGLSRFSATSRESTVPSIYPASTTHEHTVEPKIVYRHGSHPYGYFSSPSSQSAEVPSLGRNRQTATSASHGHSPATSASLRFQPPAPAYLESPTRRTSGYSQASGNSAAHAEIIEVPRRKISVSRERSTLARAVLYPAPGAKVAMALSHSPGSPSPSMSPKRSEVPVRPTPTSNRMAQSSLSSIERPSIPHATSPHLPSPSQLTSQPLKQREQTSAMRDSVIDDGDDNGVITTAISLSTDQEDYDADGKPKRGTRAISGYSVGSVPETLQAVRELAKKFPGLPPGALVGDIGFRASTMTPPKERDEVSSISGQSHKSAAMSRGRGHVSYSSTDTEEIIRKRIPAGVKMKGKMSSEAPSEPLPPMPSQQVQQLPPPMPQRNPNRPQPSQLLRTRQILQLSSQNMAPNVAQAQSQFPVAPIDPFDDDESYRGTGTELSPLSMSVKLRHPQSFMSSMNPSTRPQSGMTVALTSGLTSPVSLSYYSHSQEGAISPGVIDFGAALKEWNLAGRNIPGIRPMPSMEMFEGHRRSLSAQTRAEFERRQRRRIGPDSVDSYDLDVSDRRPQKQQSGTNSTDTNISLDRIKSIGKAPRRVTPNPTRGRAVRGSMHLQPLVIPASSFGKDVPVSAVGAGGLQTILGVNKAGMNVNVAQEQDDTVTSSTTEGATSSSNGRGLTRYSEALSIEDGGYVPIKLQGSRKGSYR